MAGLQDPASWQASAPAHWTGLVPMQVPLWQVSSCVHALPSLQAVPAMAGTLTQVPVAASQVPVQHGSTEPPQPVVAPPALQLPPAQNMADTAWPPSQCGAAHWALLSVYSQTKPAQTSSVHGFWSSQALAVPSQQSPPEQQ